MFGGSQGTPKGKPMPFSGCLKTDNLVSTPLAPLLSVLPSLPRSSPFAALALRGSCACFLEARKHQKDAHTCDLFQGVCGKFLEILRLEVLKTQTSEVGTLRSAFLRVQNKKKQKLCN